MKIAKTLLHESIHAILKRRFDVYPDGFLDSFKKYIQSETGSNNINHAIMRDYYIEPMVNNLKQVDNFRENDKFYRDLAWEGLHQFLTPEEKVEIISTLNQARTRVGGMNCGEY